MTIAELHEHVGQHLAPWGLRLVAWRGDPAGPETTKLTAAHIVPEPDDEFTGGERLLCSRLLPAADFARSYEASGDGICRGCYNAAGMAGLLPAGPSPEALGALLR